MSPLVILGGGGHARVLADCLLAAGREIVGYVTPADQGELLTGIHWLGDDQWLENRAPAEWRLINGLGSTGDATARRDLFTRYRAKGFRFDRVVHPAALISPRAQVGVGCQLLPGATVNAGARIGDNVIINSRAIVEHDCVLGDHVHIAPGAVLCGDCRVGDGTHLGAGAVVLQGTTIGAGAIIAAGAVVTRKVEPLTLMAGVPAVERKKLASS